MGSMTVMSGNERAWCAPGLAEALVADGDHPAADFVRWFVGIRTITLK
jgi:hypothetical protein